MPNEFDDARVKLVMHYPFWGSLVLQMPEVEVPAAKLAALTGFPTAAVVVQKDREGYRQELWYCREFVEPLTRNQRQGLMAHEALHLGLGHCFPWRRGKRELKRWGAATDYAVNQIVRDSGLDLPPGGLYDPKFEDMSAEQIYDLLPPHKHGEGCHGLIEVVVLLPKDSDKPGEKGKSKSKQQKPGKQQKPDGSGEPDEDEEKQKPGPKSGSQQKPQPEPSPDDDPDGTDDEPGDEPGEGEGDAGEGPDFETVDMDNLPGDVGREMEEKWKNALVRAVMLAKAQGKCPAGLERLVEELITPKIPWQQLLEQYLSEVLKSDYDWTRCDRRHLGGMTVVMPDGSVDRSHAMYLPDLWNEGAEVVVAVDTSGSIDEATLKNFASEVAGMLRARNVKKIWLLACDAEVTLFEELKPGDPILKKFGGGGGTDFRPVFDRVQEEIDKGVMQRPKVLIYCTDLYGSFPEAESIDYPVIWLSVHNDDDAPFGRTLRYDVTDDEVASRR